MTRSVGILLLALAGLAMLPQTALAGQFKKPVYYSAPGLPVALVTADFDHDGNLDLAVADFGNEVVEILLGRGDGSFRKGQSISITYPYSPTGMAVGDFDGDRILDLVVVEDNGPANGKLGVFLGNGDGTFRAGVEYHIGFEPLSASVADFNGDGRLDVVVTNRGLNGNGSVMVFFGNGDGTFRGPTMYKMTSYPYSVAVGDLNGDGVPDLAVAEYSAGVAVLLNKGGGKFGKPVVYPVYPAAVTDVVITDLNHDGNSDLVVATFDAVGVLLGKGGGKFRKAALYSTLSISSGSPQAVVVADFNLDGKPDIATVLDEGPSGLLYGNGDGTFKPVIPIKLGNHRVGENLTAGDFNNDDAADLAILDGYGYVGIFINSQ
jgi:hypothetical protein